jgi:hypothetical protein
MTVILAPRQAPEPDISIVRRGTCQGPNLDRTSGW